MVIQINQRKRIKTPLVSFFQLNTTRHLIVPSFLGGRILFWGEKKKGGAREDGEEGSFWLREGRFFFLVPVGDGDAAGGEGVSFCWSVGMKIKYYESCIFPLKKKFMNFYTLFQILHFLIFFENTLFLGNFQRQERRKIILIIFN